MWLCNICHNRYDSGWSIATTMYVWDKAMERFQKFKDQIKENHTILEYFNHEFNKKIP